MKKIVFICLILFTSIVLFAKVVEIEYFNASSENNTIVIVWKTSSELNAQKFEIERANSGDNSYSKVATVDAKGYSYTYRYIDEDIYKSGGTTLAKSAFKYRLKIVDKDGSYAYSNEISATNNVSGVRRTWGMIKEMFR